MRSPQCAQSDGGPAPCSEFYWPCRVVCGVLVIIDVVCCFLLCVSLTYSQTAVFVVVPVLIVVSHLHLHPAFSHPSADCFRVCPVFFRNRTTVSHPGRGHRKELRGWEQWTMLLLRTPYVFRWPVLRSLDKKQGPHGSRRAGGRALKEKKKKKDQLRKWTANNAQQQALPPVIKHRFCLTRCTQEART